jgi:hypothetical protein
MTATEQICIWHRSQIAMLNDSLYSTAVGKASHTHISRAIVTIACVSSTPHNHHSYFVVGLYIQSGFEMLVEKSRKPIYFMPFQLFSFFPFPFFLAPDMSYI